MEEKRRIRLRWRRLVCYLLILLAAASCYIVLRSYLLLMVVLLLVGVLAVSVYGACRLAESIQVVLCFSERQVIQGETLELKAELTGRRWISLECLLSLTAENIFLESSSPFEISSAGPGRSYGNLQYSVKGQAFGILPRKGRTHPGARSAGNFGDRSAGSGSL